MTVWQRKRVINDLCRRGKIQQLVDGKRQDHGIQYINNYDLHCSWSLGRKWMATAAGSDSKNKRYSWLFATSYSTKGTSISFRCCESSSVMNVSHKVGLQSEHESAWCVWHRKWWEARRERESSSWCRVQSRQVKYCCWNWIGSNDEALNLNEENDFITESFV